MSSSVRLGAVLVDDDEGIPKVSQRSQVTHELGGFLRSSENRFVPVGVMSSSGEPLKPGFQDF